MACGKFEFLSLKPLLWDTFCKGHNSAGAEMPLGGCAEGFTCSEKLSRDRRRGDATGLYSSSLASLRAFEEIFYYYYWSPPLMEAGDL